MARTGIPTGGGGVINPDSGGDSGGDGGGSSGGGGGSVDAGGFGEELGGDPAEGGGVDTDEPADEDNRSGTDDDADTTTTTDSPGAGTGTGIPGAPTGSGDGGGDTTATDGMDTGAGGDTATDTTTGGGAGEFGEELGGDPAEGGGVDTTPDDTADAPGAGTGTGIPGAPTDEDPTQPDVNGTDAEDPDTGSTETTRLREDAQSDPMNPQTERVDVGPGGGGRGAGLSSAEAERLRREVEQRDRTTFDARSPGAGTGTGIPGAPTESRARRRARQPPERVSRPAGGFASVRGGTPAGAAGGGALADVDRQIEAQVGAQRAESLGVTNPTLRRGVIAATNLERGEDYTVDVDESEEGLRVQARLTPQTQERLTREFAERRFEGELGIDLDRETDIEVTDEGARLSESGRRKAAGDEAFEQSEDIDLGGLPFVPEGTSLLDVKEAGEGVVRDVREVATEEAEDFQFTRGVSPLAGGYQVGDPETLPQARREAEVDTDSPIREQAESFFVGAGTLVAAPASIAVTGIEATEAGLETRDIYADEGAGTLARIEPREGGGVDVERGEGALGYAGGEAAETGVETVEGLERAVRSPTGRAQLAGSLAGSALIMGGAAAVSSRAGLASRLAIQPGEEALGYGGHFATRAVAGQRAADRLFPDNEPLIFSEEAAIRGARRAGGAARRGAGRVGAAVRRDIRTADRGQLDLTFGRERGRASEPTVITGSDLADETATADLDEPTTIFDRPERVGRKRSRAGLTEQGEFVGSFTRQQDPAFGGSGKPNLGPSRDFSGVFDGPEFEFGTEAEPATEIDQEAASRQEVLQEVEGPARRREAAEAPEVVEETETVQRQRQRFETALQPTLTGTAMGQLESPLTRADARPDTRADTRGDLRTDIVSDLDIATETDVETRAEVATDTELALDTELAMEGETETAGEFEILSEAETETEAETEFEFETETENEVEAERDRRTDDEDDPLSFTRSGWAARLDRDLINPFTGE